MTRRLGQRERFDDLHDLDQWEIRAAQNRYQAPNMKPGVQQYTIYSFRWSDTEYTPTQLLDNFGDHLPFLVITTQGFLGRDEWMNTVASDEVYWLRGVITLPRLVVRNEYNAYFSIPITCTHPVIPLNNGVPAAKPIKIKQIMEEGGVEAFLFQEEIRHNVYQGARAGDLVKFGVLDVVETYDERYLKVHSLCFGNLYHEPCVVPMYMPITMSIALGMDTGDFRDFYRTMIDMYNFTTNLPRAVGFPNHFRVADPNEITMYDKKPTDGIYDVLEPARYVKVNRSKDQRHQVDSHLYSSLDVQSSGPHPPARSSALFISEQRDGERDKPRMPTPPPGSDMDQYGGQRGPNTYIEQMSKQGYYVVDVDPRIALVELNEVLASGVVPQTTKVKMIDVSENVEAYWENKRAVPVIYPPSNPGPPVAPRNINQGVVRPRVLPPVPEPQHPPVSAPQQPKTHSGKSTTFLAELKGIVGQKKKRKGKEDNKPAGSGTTTVVTNQMYDDSVQPIQSNIYEPVPEYSSGTATSHVSGHIQALTDIPEDISGLDCDSLSQCLSLLNLSKHTHRFQDEQIDGSLLVDLDAEILQTDFNFTKFEATKLVKFAHGWRPN